MECSMVNYVYKYKTVIVWNHVIVAKLLKKYPKLSKIIKNYQNYQNYEN